MGIRVLSGVHFLEILAYLLPLCNEDTSPVTPALIFRGVTKIKDSQTSRHLLQFVPIPFSQQESIISIKKVRYYRTVVGSLNTFEKFFLPSFAQHARQGFHDQKEHKRG
ncbi:hypothetical protein HanXRQr2_Chr10g0427901 [Helianthus annuus]|uniref:Secreted protein n=1 Tax=Helianthus annuus TaxID=4232 RepID=A0A9K3HVB4_HELAN|nr:hypothetical protein HanXRQr2_Chr10g0427901 [Helianthus annuus]